MRELQYIEVKVEPSYRAVPGGVQQALTVNVKFNGREYRNTEEMWPSDAVSVLDFCFDRAIRSIKQMIERDEKETTEKK